MNTAFMVRHFYLVYGVLLITIHAEAQTWHSPSRAVASQSTAPAYRDIYRRAEKFYAADNETHYSDSAAMSGYEQVVAYLQKTPQLDGSILFDSYLKCGILHLSWRESGKAVPFFRNAILTVKTDHRLPDSLLFTPYLYMGSCHYESFDFDSSLYYYKLAEAVLENHPALSESERLYNKVGVLYYESGDYRRSIQYFSRALAIVRGRKRSDSMLIANYENNIASSLLKMEEYNKAIGIYKRLLSYHSYQNELIYNIGAAYLNAGDPSQSIRWLKKARSGGMARYNSLARAWLQLQNYDKAAQNLRLAMAEHQRARTKQKSQDFANTLKYSGDLFLALGSPLKAIDSYQQAIIQLDREFDDPSPARNPSSFLGLRNSFLLFDALVAKARAFRLLGKSVSDTGALINAFAGYAAALSLAKHAEHMYYADDARLFFAGKADTVYKEIVNIGYRIYQLRKDPVWLEKIFAYQEAGKASVLQARLGDPGAWMLKGKARDLLLEARKKQAEAARLNLLSSSTDDSARLNQLQNSIRDLELQVSVLQEKLDQYPEYYRGKFESDSLSIPAIQKDLLTKEHVLLSYYYTGEALYCFYITREQFGCVVTALDPQLTANVLSLRNHPGAAAILDRHAFNDLTRSLSRQLIDPVYDKLKNKSRLVIIPCNELSYIPFEALETAPDHRLLVKDFSVSYDYSANIMHRSAQPVRRIYKVLAMAPFTDTGSLLPQLKNSLYEVDGLPGKVLQGYQATRSQFIRWLPHYPIIHLATHATLNEQDPFRSYIEFYSTDKMQADSLHRLYEQEIYYLGMDSVSLVILSACETGSGNLVQGEGVISLSRAFSYAGCKSVITSLWEADDAATAFIIQRVHRYLMKGESKDRALQLAKIDYLDNAGIENRYKTPAYWAHLILLGDYGPVAKKSYDRWVFPTIFVLLLTLSAIFWKRKKSRIRTSVPGKEKSAS